MPKQPSEDRIGKVYGGWTVTALIPKLRRGSDANYMWMARCVCGKTSPLSHKQLGENKFGCRACANKGPIRNIRRPYEAVYNVAKKAITQRLSRTRLHTFTISYEEFLEICLTGRCHYCHVPLEWAKYINKKVSSAYQIDRKNNELGYIPDNVVGCCKRCNYGKGSSYTYEEWFAMTECFRDGRFVPTRETKTNWGQSKH